MTDLQSKTDEELNVMLAEAAGYRLEKFTKVWDSVLSPQDRIRLLRPDGSEVTWFHDIGLPFELVMYDGHLPQFCSSLDEVAKVEAGLKDRIRNYRTKLGHLVWNQAVAKFGRADLGNPQFEFECNSVNATARQRTIALISTLTKTL